MKDYIPQIEPWIDEKELIQLKRVIDSTYVTENELTKEFEALIRKLTGSKHAIAMTNGTVALYSCLKAIGVGPGDEVIVPDMTFIATANAVIMAGATPVFCDVRKDTFCINISKVEKLITNKTKAIMPVHLYGQSAEMGILMQLASKYSLKVIEDAAQGVGVFYNKKHVGTYGDMGILSFYGNKTITCGEGGVIITDDDELAKACYRLKNHGRDGKGVFIHDHIGYNFCFTEMQAAIGISQLHKLDKIIKKKRKIHDKYVKELEPIKEYFKPVYIDPKTRPVFWFTSFMTDYRDELIEYLKSKNIGTRIFFHPLHMQPCYKGVFKVNVCPVSKNIYNRGISLPSSYMLTKEQQDYVIKSIFEYFKGKKND